jgi:hypothetical protein
MKILLFAGLLLHVLSVACLVVPEHDESFSLVQNSLAALLSVRSYSRLKDGRPSLFAFDQFLPSCSLIMARSVGPHSRPV